MKCAKWRIMLSAAADSELDGHSLDALAAHIKICRDCRSFAASLDGVRAEFLKDAAPAKFVPPEFFETRLAARIESEKVSRGTSTHFRNFFAGRFAYVSAAAAVMAVFIYIAVTGVRPQADSSREDYVSYARHSGTMATLAALSSSEEEEIFDAAIINVYYGMAPADSYLSDVSDDNNGNNVSRVGREREVV